MDRLKYLHDYFDSGKPWIALRTTNHGFMGGKKYIVQEHSISLQEMLGGTLWHITADGIANQPEGSAFSLAALGLRFSLNNNFLDIALRYSDSSFAGICFGNAFACFTVTVFACLAYY